MLQRIFPGRDVACNVSIAFTGIALLFMMACRDTPSSHFQLEVNLRNAQPGVLYLYRLMAEQAPALIDSFQVSKLDENFVLHDQTPLQEVLYQLSMPNLRTNLYFISDVAKVQTRIDAVSPRNYTTTGSRGSLALQHLQRTQNPLIDSLSILNNKINNQIGDEAQNRLLAEQLRQRLMAQHFAFADTTRSPLAALLITQQLDFGNDRARHKAFITRLEKRFKHQAQLANFIQKTKDYLALREIEYEIGDTLPPATFTDLNGLPQAPAQWKNSYVLLEFWASYCGPCLQQLDQKKALFQKYRFQGFKMLTFSLDQDQEMLQAVLRSQQYPWPVIADLKGWGSAGVNAYKIDSIPFNFLLAPNGKIMAKNVGVKTLEQLLKQAN